jgi:hypothetical protein
LLISESAWRKALGEFGNADHNVKLWLVGAPMRGLFPGSIRWTPYSQAFQDLTGRSRNLFSACRRNLLFYAPLALIGLILFVSAVIGRNLAFILIRHATHAIPALTAPEPKARSEASDVRAFKAPMSEKRDRASRASKGNPAQATDPIAAMRMSVSGAFPVDWPRAAPELSDSSEAPAARPESHRAQSIPVPYFQVDSSCAKYENYLQRQCVLREQKSFDLLISVWDRTGSAIRTDCIARAKISPTDQYRVLESCVHLEAARQEAIKRIQGPTPHFDYRGYFSEGEREPYSY